MSKIPVLVEDGVSKIEIVGDDAGKSGSVYYLSINNGEPLCPSQNANPPSTLGLGAYFASSETRIKNQLYEYFRDYERVATILAKIRKEIGGLL